MKYTAFWLTFAAACAFSAGSALAQGAGQGQHEVGSGVGNPSAGAPNNGGTGGNNTSGQGHYGPNGSGGAPISNGPNGNSAGQGQFEAGGSGGGNNGAAGAAPNAVAPAPQPQAVPNRASANNPANLKAPKEDRNEHNNLRQGDMGRMNDRSMHGENDWRFVYSNGMWWYYQPDNSWTYYQNDAWQNYSEPRTARMDRDHRNMQDHASGNRDENAVNHETAKRENGNKSNDRVEKH